MRTVVSGAAGFVGRAVSGALEAKGDEVVRLARKALSSPVTVGSDVLDYPQVLSGTSADVFVHLVGVTGRNGREFDERAVYQVNVAGTAAAVAAAKDLGVSHFIHMSSVGVHGRGGANEVIDSESPIDPYDPYTISKAVA